MCGVTGVATARIHSGGGRWSTEMHDGLRGERGRRSWDAYGLEKLASEEVYKHYQSDFNIQAHRSIPQHLRTVRNVEG